VSFGGDVAGLVRDQMEQARVEALGGQHLSGLGDNLMAALDARALKRGFDNPDIAKDDTSFAEAVGLYAREQLTGRKLPKSTDGIMGAWREEISLKSAGRFENLKTSLDDQDTFGKFVQDLIADFELGDDMASADEEGRCGKYRGRPRRRRANAGCECANAQPRQFT